MASNIEVSVVIPAYNSDRYLQAAIDSVLLQKNCQYELIVVDDGSTDTTAQIAKSYQSKLRYFSQENSGVSSARNLGINHAQGKYISFLDADDYFLANKLSAQLEVFKADSSIGIVHSGWQRINAETTLLCEVCPWENYPTLDFLTWLQHKPVLPSAMMFDRQWLQKVEGFDPQLAAAEDVDLVLRLAIEGCKSQWLPIVTTAYRQHGASAMGNSQVQADCLAIMLDKIFSHPKLPAAAQLLENKVRRGTLTWSAWYLYQTGETQAMADQLLNIYNLSPQLITVSLIEWVECFDAFSKAIGEELDVDALISSEPWKNLKRLLLKQQEKQVIF